MDQRRSAEHLQDAASPCAIVGFACHRQTRPNDDEGDNNNEGQIAQPLAIHVTSEMQKQTQAAQPDAGSGLVAGLPLLMLILGLLPRALDARAIVATKAPITCYLQVSRYVRRD